MFQFVTTCNMPLIRYDYKIGTNNFISLSVSIMSEDDKCFTETTVTQKYTE